MKCKTAMWAMMLMLLWMGAMRQARAQGCDVSWVNAMSGSWSEPARWSTGKVPDTHEHVCIGATGAPYTVVLDMDATVAGFTLNAADATFEAAGRMFTVNGPAILAAGRVVWNGSVWGGSGPLTNEAIMVIQGNATLASPFVQNGQVFVSGGVTSAVLTVNGGFTNAGQITLENTSFSTTASNLSVISGTLTNAMSGMILIHRGTGGEREIAADILNQGTIQVNTDAFLTRSGGMYENAGRLAVTNGATLTLIGAPVFRQNDGVLDLTSGSFAIWSGTFQYNGGQIEGPVLIQNSELDLRSTTPATFSMRGDSRLRGDIAPGQVVAVHGSSPGATLTAATGFINAGQLILENVDFTSTYSNLTVITGTLTNAATGVIEINQGTGGTRKVSADLVNRGTIRVQTSVEFPRLDGVFVNEGHVELADGVTLSLIGRPTFHQKDGMLDAAGASFVMWNGTFNHEGGEVTGRLTLYNTALNLQGTSPASFSMRGNSTLSGNIAQGQAVAVNGENPGATLTAATSFTNAGILSLENAAFSVTSSNLTLLTGTLTNATTGVIHINPGTGGSRTIIGDIVNDGVVYVRTSAHFAKANTRYVNNGLTILAGGGLSINGRLTNQGQLHQIRQVSGSADAAFLQMGGYGGLLLNSQGEDLGSTRAVIRGQQDCTSLPGETVRRCFFLDFEKRVGEETIVIFAFRPDEIPSGQQCETLEAFYYDGLNYISLPLDEAYGTMGRICEGEMYSIKAKVSRMVGFTPFVLKSGGPPAGFPLPPALAWLTGETAGATALIQWQTAMEEGIEAFHVWRSAVPNGEWQRVTAAALPAQGTGVTGQAYQFADVSASYGHTYFYRLEVVRDDGRLEWAGPIQLTMPRAVFLPLVLRQGNR